jgi:AraC family L-rhamnose operon regulatory protein RhaS
MSALPQIYKEHGKTYHADTCEPLVRAVEAGRVTTEILARGSYPGKRLAQSALPGICTIGYWDAVGRQDWGLKWHRNEGIELTFLETGSLDFAVDDQRFSLQPNDLTITRPWQVHRVGNPNVGVGRFHWVILDVNVRRPNQAWHWPDWIILTKPDLKELTRILRYNEISVWCATAEIRRCFRDIAAAVKADCNGSSISLIAAHLNELLVQILQMFHNQKVRLNPSLASTQRTVKLFLDDLRDSAANLAQPWTLKLMANRCGLGVTWFVFHCKQLTNLSPMQYLARCRVEAASRLLLQSPDVSITDIAIECGFGSSQYFATVFARHIGCSPSEFRESNRRAM